MVMEETNNSASTAYLQQNQSTKLIVVNIVLLTIAVLAVILRLISRRVSKAPFWWDDGIMVLALFLNFGSSAFNFSAATYGAGKHHEVLTAAQQVALGKVVYGIEILYGPLLTAIKSAILVFYLRLFGVRKGFRITIYVFEALVICWCLSIFFASIFQSTPPRYLWTPDLPNAHTINFTKYLVGLAVPNVAMDFAILALPVSIVWQLQISKRRKIALSAVFAVGIFVCGVSIVRAYSVATVDNSDKSYSYANTLIWSAVEANVGITCACLPIMQPVVQKVVRMTTGSERSKHSKDTPRARRGDTSHETFESSSRPLRKSDEDVIRVPPRVIPANSTWVSSGQEFNSYGYQEIVEEASVIPMNAIHVKNDVNLERGQQA